MELNRPVTLLLTSSGAASADPAAEAGLPPSGQGPPPCPQAPAQACEGGAGGGALHLHLPQSRVELGAGLHVTWEPALKWGRGFK